MSRPVKPGPVVVPQTCEVKLYWSNGTNQFTNVLHGNHGGTTAINEQLADTLHTSISNALVTSGWAAIMHPSVALYQVGVKDISAPFLPEYLSNGAAQAGTGALSPLGDHTAICVTEQTAKSGREWRGRIYLGGLDAAATADGRVASQAAVDAAGAFGEAVRSAFTTAQIPMCVAQRELLAGMSSSGTALPPRSANPVPVTRCIVRDTRLDTQRRRVGR